MLLIFDQQLAGDVHYCVLTILQYYEIFFFSSFCFQAQNGIRMEQRRAPGRNKAEPHTTQTHTALCSNEETGSTFKVI